MKKSRCISLKHKIGSEWQEINFCFVIAGGIASLALAWFACMLTHSYAGVDKLCHVQNGVMCLLYPVIWTIMNFIIGGAVGAVISSCEKSVEAYKLRGILYFLLVLLLNFLWQIVTIKLELLFCGFVILCVMSLFLFLSMLCVYRVYRISALVLFAYWLWLVYMTYINLSLVFLAK